LDETTVVFINCLKLKDNSSLASWFEVMRVKLKGKEQRIAMYTRTFHLKVYQKGHGCHFRKDKKEIEERRKRERLQTKKKIEERDKKNEKENKG